MQALILKKDEERRLLAGHLWVYSNEIDIKRSPLKNFSPGELIEIRSASNKILGRGYVNPNTLLAARLLTTDQQEKIDQDFFNRRIKKALKWREPYFTKPYYRLIFGESDQLPGIVVDRFADTLVAQFNSAGMENLQDLVITALIQELKPQAIFLRNDSSIRVIENLPRYVKAIYGAPEEQVTIEENGVIFNVAIKAGQKTGWFYDQRTNRKLISAYVKNKKVLDVFSYSGGFGVTAAVAGAEEVICIDSSAQALGWLQENAKLNQVSDKITTINQDGFLALEELQLAKRTFDLIILDPPAFIKRHKDLMVGKAAYLNLHRLALRLLKPEGVLLTSSCSLHLSREMLLNILRIAMVKERRGLAIIEQLHQACDHPVHPAIAETNYLKGFIAQSL